MSVISELELLSGIRGMSTNLKNDEVLIVKVDTQMYRAKEMQEIIEAFRRTYHSNRILIIDKNIDLEFVDKNGLVKLLHQLINNYDNSHNNEDNSIFKTDISW